jgi:hypothetical protein
LITQGGDLVIKPESFTCAAPDLVGDFQFHD